jgi:hypothetical protein
MQLRREQKEEQATETQNTIYETEQQQEQKKKDDKKRKEITKPNHTTQRIQEWLTVITQLDGTGGGHEPLSKMAKQARQRALRKGGTRKVNATRECCGLAATATTASPRGLKGTKFATTKGAPSSRT